MRKKLKKNKLKNAEKTMIDELCESVIISHSELDWSNTLLSCIDDPNRIESLITSVEIQELSVNHNLDLYSAALLYHSNRRG